MLLSAKDSPSYVRDALAFVVFYEFTYIPTPSFGIFFGDLMSQDELWVAWVLDWAKRCFG